MTLNQQIEHESQKLNASILQAVSNCKMPAAVTKIVLQNTARDIIQVINSQIANEKEENHGEE